MADQPQTTEDAEYEAMLDAINFKSAALSERLYELIINSMAPTRAMRLASMLALADCAALVIESCGEMRY